MRRLDADWFFSGLLDYEYKRYIFLAYEQFARAELQNVKLYPLLTDLQMHFQSLKSYDQAKEVLSSSLPKEISLDELKNFKVKYKPVYTEPKFLQEVQQIAAFAIPRVSQLMDEGKERYQQIESKIEVVPLGISSLNIMEGFFLLSQLEQTKTQLFAYNVTIFETAEENLRGIRVKLVQEVEKSAVQTFESLKTELIKKHATYPNPATFLVSVSVPCPFEETLMPIAKRTLVRYVSTLQN
jgi:hypothetical protein